MHFAFLWSISNRYQGDEWNKDFNMHLLKSYMPDGELHYQQQNPIFPSINILLPQLQNDGMISSGAL